MGVELKYQQPLNLSPGPRTAPLTNAITVLQSCVAAAAPHISLRGLKRFSAELQLSDQRLHERHKLHEPRNICGAYGLGEGSDMIGEWWSGLDGKLQGLKRGQWNNNMEVVYFSAHRVACLH